MRIITTIKQHDERFRLYVSGLRVFRMAGCFGFLPKKSGIKLCKYVTRHQSDGCRTTIKR